MSHADPMTLIMGVASLMAALVLAWRAYRSAARYEAQKKREREKDDRR